MKFKNAGCSSLIAQSFYLCNDRELFVPLNGQVILHSYRVHKQKLTQSEANKAKNFSKQKMTKEIRQKCLTKKKVSQTDILYIDTFPKQQHKPPTKRNPSSLVNFWVIQHPQVSRKINRFLCGNQHKLIHNGECVKYVTIVIHYILPYPQGTLFFLKHQINLKDCYHHTLREWENLHVCLMFIVLQWGD